jgi:hypothetical protein
MKIKTIHKAGFMVIAISLALIGVSIHLATDTATNAGTSLAEKISDNIKKIRKNNVLPSQNQVE